VRLDRGVSQGPQGHPRTRGAAGLTLVLGALGVVYGDIGTSPLYALQTVFDRWWRGKPERP
jgi:KUP system potassium uptake protein